jgi:hypothetical protein
MLHALLAYELASGAKGPIDKKFATCFLESLTTLKSWSNLTTATNMLVGPLLDLAEVMINQKRCPQTLMSKMYDAVCEIAISAAWKDPVAQPYVPKCISLLTSSVSNWKYAPASQVTGMCSVLNRVPCPTVPPKFLRLNSGV